MNNFEVDTIKVGRRIILLKLSLPLRFWAT